MSLKCGFVGLTNSGKTTLCNHIIAQGQKVGVCAMIDMEQSWDRAYAAKVGVDTDNLLFSQPSCGEEALKTLEYFIKTNKFAVIVVDSIASLVPRAELEGEIDANQQPAGQARLMSQVLRKLMGSINISQTVVVFTNQMREKVGVMFGCLHGETLINFEDGRSLPIREVVDNRIQGNVITFDEPTNSIVFRKITDWHHNGDVGCSSDYLSFVTGAFDSKNGLNGFTVTPNHEIMTELGWRKASNVNVGDKLLSRYRSIFNGSVKDFLVGTFIGDCHISRRSDNTASLKFQDKNNPEYLQWKIAKLGILEFKQNGSRLESEYRSEWSEVKKLIPNRDVKFFFSNYSELSLALWYMDDGCFDENDSHSRSSICVKRFAKNIDTMGYICEEFKKRGFDCHFKNGNVVFDKENTLKIHKAICKFIPACMEYKLADCYRGKYEDFKLEHTEELKPSFVEIKAKTFASGRKMRMKGKYDISVADTKSYFVGGVTNGILVHNSPETTPGGNAMKFYATLRFDMRKIAPIKDSTGDMIGHRCRVKIIKNKVAPPFQIAEFDMLYGYGIVPEFDIIDCALEAKVMVKKGAWIALGEEMIGQGRQKAAEALSASPELKSRVQKAIMEVYVDDREEDTQPMEDGAAQQPSVIPAQADAEDIK